MKMGSILKLDTMHSYSLLSVLFIGYKEKRGNWEDDDSLTFKRKVGSSNKFGGKSYKKKHGVEIYIYTYTHIYIDKAKMSKHNCSI